MRRIVEAVFWWSATIIVLIIVDDLVFGPVFWAVSTIDRTLATSLAFIASWLLGFWLVYAGIRQNRGKLADFLLSRLMLKRKNKEIAKREEQTHEKVTSTLWAILVTPLIGGVIPSLLLHKKAIMDDKKIIRLSVLLAAIYALEFATIHGGYGIGGLIARGS